MAYEDEDEDEDEGRQPGQSTLDDSTKPPAHFRTGCRASARST
jgi:hypothetical protein